MNAIEPQVNPKELKAICKEYEFDDDNAIWEEEPRVYAIKKALSKIDKADYIIFCLYMELQSERKVAKQLGVSRTPVNKTIKRIKSQIMEIINNYDNDSI